MLRTMPPEDTVNFSKRLSQAAAVMTWVGLVLGVIAATLLDRFGQAGAPPIHLEAVYAWAAVGLLSAALLTALPAL